MAVAAALARTPCEASPRRIGECFWVRGRYSAWNGTPTFRVWHVGTHHVLGIHDAANTQAAAYPPPPPEVRSVIPAHAGLFDAEVYGDYLLCPFTKAVSGRMQFVCIARATHLRPRMRNPQP